MEVNDPVRVKFSSFEEFLKQYQLTDDKLDMIVPGSFNLNEIINAMTAKFARLLIDKIKIKDEEYYILVFSK